MAALLMDIIVLVRYLSSSLKKIEKRLEIGKNNGRNNEKVIERERDRDRKREREKGCVNHKYSENIFWKHFSIHN